MPKSSKKIRVLEKASIQKQCTQNRASFLCVPLKIESDIRKKERYPKFGFPSFFVSNHLQSFPTFVFRWFFALILDNARCITPTVLDHLPCRFASVIDFLKTVKNRDFFELNLQKRGFLFSCRCPVFLAKQSIIAPFCFQEYLFC